MKIIVCERKKSGARYVNGVLMRTRRYANISNNSNAYYYDNIIYTLLSVFNRNTGIVYIPHKIEVLVSEEEFKGSVGVELILKPKMHYYGEYKITGFLNCGFHTPCLYWFRKLTGWKICPQKFWIKVNIVGGYFE